MGTESPSLLLAVYKLLGSGQRNEAEAARLLEQRDRFVAARIGEMLAEDEAGLLFMGALHHVANYLPERIRVEDLMVRSVAPAASSEESAHDQ